MTNNKNNSNIRSGDLYCYKNPKTKRKCSKNIFFPKNDIGTNVHYPNANFEYMDNNKDNLDCIKYSDSSIKTNKKQLFESYVAEYKSPEIKIILNTEYLREIVKELKVKDRIFTRRKISELIGISEDIYQKVLYKGYQLSINIFNKFKSLFLDNFSKQFLLELYKKYTSYEKNLITHFEDDLIPHKKIIGQFEYMQLEENEELAEFMCIMCGDGHLSEDSQTVMITLNPVDEEHYVDYTISMICNIFNLNPNELYYHEIEGQKTLQVILRRKSIHYSLVEKGKRTRDNKNGLIPGDKLKNQIGVPDFVFKNKKSVIRGLKGLFDTDGGITVNHDKRIALNFENYSITLLNDFHKMCNLVEINSTLSKKSYQVNITESKSVRKFLELVNPEKIKEPYKRIWLAANILKKIAPVEIRKGIQKEIINYKRNKNKKKFQYSKFHLKKIRHWLEIHYNQFLQKYPAMDSELMNCNELNQYIIERNFKLGDILINSLINLALTEDIYNKIRLHKDKDEVYQIQRDLHYYIIDFIYSNLLNSKFSDDNSLILGLIKSVSEKLPFNILHLLRFKIAFVKYSKDLILLIREIILRSDPKILRPISPYYLLKHFEKKGVIIPFKYTFLRSTFLPYLKNRYPKRFLYIKDFNQ